MYFCENCRFVSEQEYCPVCGSKNRRQVQAEDFCLLTENNTAYCNMLTEIFDDNNIRYSAVPYGRGVRSQFGLPLENYRLYVQYECLEQAKNIIKQIEDSETDELRNDLLKNADKLNILAKAEKKYRKKLKLAEDEDFFEYCVHIIKTAVKIEDKGLHISSKGHYLFCLAEDATLMVNSGTYEILSLTIK